MFLGKNKEKKQKKQSADAMNTNAQSGVDAQIEKDIHVMPDRFYAKPKKTSKALVVLLAVLGILIIFGAATAVYFLYIAPSQSVPQQPPQANTNTNTATNSNANVNNNANTNTDTNTNSVNSNANTNAVPQQPPQANTNTNTATNSNTNVNSNSNTNTPTNTTTASNINVSTPTTITQRAADTDSDGLSAAEEALYGTNPSQNDSDGDTFRDGSELTNGYDPAAPSATLLESGVFLEYEAAAGYSIQYPSAWQVVPSGESVRFVAATGEYIEVITYTNSQNISLVNWYQQTVQQQTGMVVDQISIDNSIVLRARNGQAYYFNDANQNRVIAVQYYPGNSDVLNFTTTYSAMIQTFDSN